MNQGHQFFIDRLIEDLKDEVDTASCHYCTELPEDMTCLACANALATIDALEATSVEIYRLQASCQDCPTFAEQDAKIESLTAEIQRESQLRKTVTEERDELVKVVFNADKRIEDLLRGLRFYANGRHMAFADEVKFEWEDVSGEPPNWLQNNRSDHYEMIEDGTIAKMVLRGEGQDWSEHDDGEPPAIEGEASVSDIQRCDECQKTGGNHFMDCSQHRFQPYPAPQSKSQEKRLRAQLPQTQDESESICAVDADRQDKQHEKVHGAEGSCPDDAPASAVDSQRLCNCADPENCEIEMPNRICRATAATRELAVS